MAATGAAFVCAKCKGTQYETDEFRATGGFFSKMFDIQNTRFPASSAGIPRCIRVIPPSWGTFSTSSPVVSRAIS